jgi:GNAT superfamily N-acetyltransferase
MQPPVIRSQSVELIELVSGASPHLTEARELLLEYGRFVISQPGVAHFCLGSLETEAARLPGSYRDLGGGCLLARVAGKPAGFVAWRELPAVALDSWDDSWELKRLWVRPEARGLHLGRTLTFEVLDRAIQAGRKSVYLDTVPEAMAAAHQLYLQLGFIPCEKYNDNPVDGLAYLVKHL